MSIQQKEAKALSFGDLKRMLGPLASQVKFYNYAQLASIQNISGLLAGHIAAIILLQIESPNAPAVGHWVAVIQLADGSFLHFDPYGLKPDQELSITHEKPYLGNILNASRSQGMIVRYTHTQFQALREDVNTCGRWCVVRVKNRNLSNSQFKRKFHDGVSDPDALVASIT